MAGTVAYRGTTEVGGKIQFSGCTASGTHLHAGTFPLPLTASLNRYKFSAHGSSSTPAFAGPTDAYNGRVVTMAREFTEYAVL